MDPATILGMIASSAKIAHQIYSFTIAVKHAPSEVQDLTQELLAVANVLEMLRTHLEQERAKGREFHRTSVIFSSVDGCNKQLVEIHKKLSPVASGGRVTRFINRLKWPLTHQETMDAMAALHRYVQLFHFAVSIDGL